MSPLLLSGPEESEDCFGNVEDLAWIMAADGGEGFGFAGAGGLGRVGGGGRDRDDDVSLTGLSSLSAA